jgi:tRNA modification GTPase
MSTIYALASARGKSGIAVVRLSGPLAGHAMEMLAGPRPQVRHLARRKLVWNGVELDDALVVWFAKGASFTGEESAELHLHGGTATIAAVLRALSEQDGLRLAEAGEFTRCAFENGVLDLAEVEGLADLIDAETEAQRRQAMRVLSGSISSRVNLWRQSLIRAVALLEATIDFADEDVPVDVRPEVIALIDGLLEQLRSEVSDATAAERLRDGFEVAIVGAPNVGKSTLLNALAGREAAITSARAGTTRDVIEVRMDLAGLPVTLLDTAGLRDTADEVEKVGINRAIERAKGADLRVFLVEAGARPVDDVAASVDDLIVTAKADLENAAGLSVSGTTGQGIDALVQAIVDRLAKKVPASGTLTRERHRLAGVNSIRALESARIEVMATECQAEVASDHLRRALRALEALLGRVDVEQFLAEIFSSFCIGK